MRNYLRTALVVACAAAGTPALAADTFWQGPGASFIDNANWSAAAPGSADTGIFLANGAPAGVNTVGSPVGTLRFDTGAPAYTLNIGLGATLTLIQGGIANNSASTQILNAAGGNIDFVNSADVSGPVSINASASATISFRHDSSAGSASIGASDSSLEFRNNATAASAAITLIDNTDLQFFNNATAGNATIVAQDASNPINFRNSATAGAASISMTNGSVLTFYDTSSGGTAALTADASSILDFSATAGSNNDKKVGFGSLSGSGTLYLGANQVSIGGNNTSTSFSGLIADCSDDCAANGELLPTAPGTLIKTGTGNLTLTGANTYTGGTIVDAGTLTAGHNLALASAGVTINNGATLGFASGGGFILSNLVTLNGSAIVNVGGSDTNELAGPVEGTGSLNKTGTGTLILSSPANNYSGGTNVNAGILKSGANNAFGTGAITVATGASIDLNSNSQTTEQLSGSGMVVLGSGRLTVSGNGSSAFSGTISGTGGITKGGTGTLTLTGAQTYTGTTIISSGTLQLGDGTASGSLATSGITNNGNLTFNLPGNVNVTTPISGTGSVTKLGVNTLTFATTQTYTGDTFVNAGALVVNGSLASIVKLASGTTLKGSGTVAGVVANTGSFVSPGNSIGTLNVAGNTSFAAGSTYIVETNAAGQSDLINATGTAAILGGTVQVDTAAGYNTASTYTIVTAAGGVSGTFAGLTIDNPALLAFLTYDTKNVFLRIAPKALPPGSTPNQNATKDGIGSGGSIFNSLITSTTPNAQSAYDLLSGEIHATLLTSLLMDATNTRRMVGARGERPDDDPGLYFWAHADQHWGYIDGDGNAAGAHREYFQIMAGADKGIASGWRLGVEAGYGQEYLQVASRASTARFNRGTVGAYFHGVAGPIRLHGGASQMWGTVKTTRGIVYTGFSDFTTSKQNVDGTQAFVEAGYPAMLGGLPVEPIAGLSWVRSGAGSARETGGAAALDVADGSLEGIFSLLGLQTLHSYTRDDELLYTLFLRAGWQHDFSNETVLRKVSLVSTGRPSTVFGLQTDADRALIDANAAIYLDEMRLSFGYLGAISKNERDHALRADFGWKF